jgi:hypothetical protein
VILALVGMAFGQSFSESSELNADLKSFFLATFPYEHIAMPEDPVASGALDGRIRWKLDLDDLFRLEVHHAVTATTGAISLGGGSGFGVGMEAPQAVDLDWEGVGSDGMWLVGRTDRLKVESTLGPTEWSLGRQPITFGQGRFFTPLDLVNPFHPATVDSEYKPGVDAARLDIYPSASTEVTLVAAYAGDWTPDEMVFAGHGQVTLGVTDLGVFLGEVRGDRVAGLSSVGSIGPVGVYGDVAGTLPADSEEGPFVRAVLGADHRATATTSVGLELYFQSLGASSPSDYGEFGASDRVARGELWTLGQFYGGLSVLQEITPLVMLSVAGLANLADQSALVMPSVSVSVAENTDAVLGGYLGVGERPHAVELEELLSGDLGIESEFGLLPSTFFAQMRAYF